MFFYYIEMNKKSKSKRKTNTRKKIKQVGCSLNKKRLTQSGGDAYNVMPVSKIYPLEDYSSDIQRASIDAGAMEAGQQLTGGSRIGINEQSGGSRTRINKRNRRGSRRTFRKYYKRTLKGGDRSYLELIQPMDTHAQDQIYNKAAPFYV